MEEILRGKSELALSDAETALIEQRLLVLQALIEMRTILKRGDQERLRQLAETLEALPADEEMNWNMMRLFLTFWLTVRFQGEGAQLVGRLREAKLQVMEAGDPPVTIRTMAWLTLVYTRAGQWHWSKTSSAAISTRSRRPGRSKR